MGLGTAVYVNNDPDEIILDECADCEAPIYGAEECVLLSLVYPTTINGERTFLSAVEDDGSFTADPLLYCLSCWELHSSFLYDLFADMPVDRPRTTQTPLAYCAFCGKHLLAGEYCGTAALGEVQRSPRTGEPYFVPHERTIPLTMVFCLDCVDRLNTEQANAIWSHLWEVDTD